MSLHDTTNAVGLHIVRSALETYGVPTHTPVPEGVEIDWNGWNIRGYEKNGDGTLLVIAEQGGFWHEKHRRRTHKNPADYKKHSGIVRLVVLADFTDDPLSGEYDVDLEWNGKQRSTQ